MGYKDTVCYAEYSRNIFQFPLFKKPILLSIGNIFNKKEELAPVNNYFISDMGNFYLLTGRARHMGLGFPLIQVIYLFFTSQMFLLNTSYYYQTLTNTESAGHRCSKVVHSWT